MREVPGSSPGIPTNSMIFPNFKTERELYAKGYHFVAGCDEVGMAPLAGPVVAAACILDSSSIGVKRGKSKWYYRVRDSKTTDSKERIKLLPEIMSHCLAFGIGSASPQQIDVLNIHNAALLAMRAAFEDLVRKLEELLPLACETQGIKNKAQEIKNKIFLILDGRFTLKDLQSENFDLFQKAIIDADAKILSVSAASIIAKEHRDAILRQMDRELPGYGFARHKGYATREHRDAILTHGITSHHRKSFLKNFDLQFKLN